MKNAPEPSNIQRLLREWTLARYTAALERGDLETLALIMERASQDSILQLMILEVHEVYQDDNLLFLTDDKDDDMEIKTGTANSTPASEALSEKPRHTRRHTAWLRALAAVVLVCLLGGGFLGVQFWRASQATGSGQNARPAPLTRARNGLCVVNSPALNPDSTNPQLTAISGDSSNDIWVLGSNNAPAQQSVLEHWNGHTWSLVSPPQDAPGNIDQLTSIGAAGPSDAWAVGFVGLPQPSPTASSSTANSSIQQSGSHTPLTTLSGGLLNSRALLEHWNGQRWSIVPLINTYPATWGTSQLSAISVISPNDIWAVGFFEDRAGLSSDLHQSGIFKPLVVHWDGTQWNLITSPAFPERTDFNSIAALSANDIWINGQIANTETGGGSGGASATDMLLHWNGSQWQSITTPQGVYVEHLSVDSANNVWATGFSTQNGQGMYIVGHWDGQAWHTMNLPDARPRQAPNDPVYLSSVNAVSPNNVWVVGSASDYAGQIHYQVTEHWNGQQWQVLPQNRNNDPGQLLGITSVAGKIWAVGMTYTGLQQIQTPLIETSC